MIFRLVCLSGLSLLFLNYFFETIIVVVVVVVIAVIVIVIDPKPLLHPASGLDIHSC